MQFSGVKDNQNVTFAYGHAYLMEMASQAEYEAFLHEFDQRSHTAIVASDGGLISSLNVLENLVLPLDFHGISQEKTLSEVYNLLRLCGLDEPDTTAFIQLKPVELSLFERRMAGFIRAMLIAPEYLIWDMPYDGFSAGETERIRRLQNLFHLHFPLRISVTLCFGNRMPSSMDD